MSSPDQTLAVDVMGGDNGAGELLCGVRAFLQSHNAAHVLVTGDEHEIRTALEAWPRELQARISAHPTEQVIAMTDSARDALRAKPDSSMHHALQLVSDGAAIACVSAGNTAALMAVALRIVGRLDAVRRPAIIGAIPSIDGHTWLLDLGANTQCTAGQLFEFAVMGECVAGEVGKLGAPRIGLLNVGEEHGKGSAVLQEAAALLRASDLNYIGFVEGHDIFLDGVDVVVSDGFTGNVALKTMEGMARLVIHYFRDQVNAEASRSATLDGVRTLLDPRLRNGATFVGLKRVVVKSHGSADAVGFAQALVTAWNEIGGDVPQRIARRFLSLREEN